jgi:ATP-binding cassette subfamily C (CFTR/MRP) protein 1
MASSYGSIQRNGSADHNDGRRNGGDQTELTPLVPPPSHGGQQKPGDAAPSSAVDERPLWSRLLFQWFTPILRRGNEKSRLDQEDLGLVPLPADCSTDGVGEAFDACWNEELRGEDPSLVRALFRSFGADYLRGSALKLVHDLCVFVGPQVLHAMIVFLRTESAPLWHGLALTAAVTCSQIAMSLCLRHYFFKCYATGLRVRTAIVVAVYRKAVLLSAAERQSRTLGEITNLMSIDAQRMQDLMNYFNSLWSSPLQIALSLVFLWQQLGASSMGGVCVIIVMIPMTKAVAGWMGTMQRILMKAKDKRVELNVEVLSGMKVIKFQAWEEPFQDRILALREVELKQLLKYIVGTALSRMLWVFIPLLVSMATFGVYVWTGHTLDVASALTALALFDILRFPLFMLPQVINNTVEAIVSLKRVRSFLMCDEHHPVGPGSLMDFGVRMENVSAAYDTRRPLDDGVDAKTKELADKQWEVQLLRSQLDDAERRIRELSGKATVRKKSSQDELNDSVHNLLCLRRINFECKPGELIAVVGGVGCGKSSFINAVLGEVRELTGTTSVKGNLAYFSQTPFIMNTTVRNNILFGHVNEPVDEELYQRCLRCCALKHDLKLLPDGDQTEIGERGITLSGGQKARIALARAMYHKGDITLIDDALSAVDAHVAKQLFDEAIVGELLNSDDGKRSVVLVTNALQYLNHPRVDRIVVLVEGRIVEEGSYAQLAHTKDSVFARYVSVLKETGVSGSLTEGCAMPTKVSQEDKMKEESSEFFVAPESPARKKNPKKLMTEETRKEGHVGFSVYTAWSRAAGGLYVPIVILLSFTATEGISVLSNWWITYWSAHGDENSQTHFLAIYALINGVAAVAGLARMLMVAFFGLRASRQV